MKKKSLLIAACSLVAIAAIPADAFAAAHYDSSNGGWVCAHGFSTFSDKKLTYGCSNIPYWYSAGTFDRTSNSVQSKQLKTAMTRWNNADSSISFSKASSLSNARLVYDHEQLEDAYAVTRLFDTNSNLLTVTTKTPLSSNFKYAHIYICENQIKTIAEKTVRVAIVSHEVGHALGLSHINTVKQSIMCNYASGRTVNAPQSRDARSVKHIY